MNAQLEFLLFSTLGKTNTSTKRKTSGYEVFSAKKKEKESLAGSKGGSKGEESEPKDWPYFIPLSSSILDLEGSVYLDNSKLLLFFSVLCILLLLLLVVFFGDSY